MNPQALSNQQLSEMFESECALAARLYDEGLSTDEADERVEALEAEMRERGMC